MKITKKTLKKIIREELDAIKGPEIGALKDVLYDMWETVEAMRGKIDGAKEWLATPDEAAWPGGPPLGDVRVEVAAKLKLISQGAAKIKAQADGELAKLDDPGESIESAKEEERKFDQDLEQGLGV